MVPVGFSIWRVAYSGSFFYLTQPLRPHLHCTTVRAASTAVRDGKRSAVQVSAPSPSLSHWEREGEDWGGNG
jgi:hypothetical protein